MVVVVGGSGPLDRPGGRATIGAGAPEKVVYVMAVGGSAYDSARPRVVVGAAGMLGRPKLAMGAAVRAEKGSVRGPEGTVAAEKDATGPGKKAAGGAEAVNGGAGVKVAGGAEPVGKNGGAVVKVVGMLGDIVYVAALMG
jgi:hypothetical protein